MKKALVRVDANSLIGYGHFYRCFALSEMIEEVFEIHFACIALPDYLFTMVKARGWNLIPLATGYNFDHPDALSDTPIPYDLSKYADNADIVILDGYHFSEEYFCELKSTGKKVVYVDDLGKKPSCVDVIINHSPGAQIAKYKPLKKDTIYGIGLPYALIRSAFNSKKAIKRLQGHLLIALGGSDQKNLLQALLTIFLKSTDYTLHVVGNMNVYENKVLRENDRVIKHENLDDQSMSRLMNQCEIGLVPASTLVIEALACRLPVVVGMTAENQRDTYEGLKNIIGVARVGDLKAVFESDVVSAIEKLKKAQQVPDSIDEFRKQRLQSIFQLLISKQRQCNNQLTLRTSSISDSKVVYEINNDPSVRAQSINRNDIQYNDHLRWYNQKLLDPYYFFFIFEDADKATIGLTRFQMTNNCFVVSIAVREKYRGVGHGHEMLVKSVLKLRELHDQKIIAQISCDNVSSMKVFEKAGFIFDRTIIVNKHLFNQYKYAY